MGEGVDKDEIRPYFPISLNEVIVCIVSGSRNTTQNFSTLMTAVKVLNFCYQAYYLSLALYSLLFNKPFLIEHCSICVLSRLPQRQTFVNSISTNSVL